MAKSSTFATTIVQFLRFGIVGGSGVLVNMAVVVVMNKLMLWSADIAPSDPFYNLFGTAFHIRWYHVFQTVAFLVANTWNYQLNRMWTFKTTVSPKWWKGFFAFLTTGLLAFGVSLVIATLLMNPESPIALPDDVFDNSTGFRTKVYWANIISVLAAMPINFLINRLWAFRPTRIVVEQHPVQHR
ncbi:GtrA family protein [Corynebacterium pseudopelargi]|uniref:GtrA-like protein n=1 Tax=Corynebacterium pseudopelargi TaxID=2080757 RepID=A0A3G6IVA8_9CORY|nr:GtrA family protein [Corynebacterium pseudopelargi]AZA09557.1 GtrA-like protein [Corynebacterium pseudopelargi]